VTRVYLVAGEPSGDRLGAALMAGLRKLDPGVEFHGIGGRAMESLGLQSLFPMDELSVFGIVEVLPRLRSLMRRIDQTAAEVARLAPDVLVTIDSPDFSLRVAGRVRAMAPGVRTCHYVAPSVWAWRKGRARKMARRIDQVLTLLPFEPPYMEAAGMRADFVGHPVVTEPVPTLAETLALQEELSLGDAPVLVVLPGSRRGEVSRLLPVFGDVVGRMLAARPDLRVIVPAAAPVVGAVIEGTARWPGQPLVLDPSGLPEPVAEARKRTAFALGRVALAASGTVSLELAAVGTPMVIAYNVAWLTWQIVSRLIQVDTVTLVNLVSDLRAVPEFIGPDCQPGPIAGAVLALMDDGPHRAAQAEAARLTLERLGRGGAPPGERAARAVLDGLGYLPR